MKLPFLSLILRLKHFLVLHSQTIISAKCCSFTGSVIKEGQSKIYLPPGNEVFYNPVQEFNRDISVGIIQQYIKELLSSKKDGNIDQPLETGVTILDALAASGLRGIRYCIEVPGIKRVIINDISQIAVDIIQKNITNNGVQHLAVATCTDATSLMYQHYQSKNLFDIIDLDPYGSPAVFLGPAIHTIRNGGLLLLTCTDMQALSGIIPEVSFAKYGAVSIRAPFWKEMSLRIVLQTLQVHASRYSRYIIPLLSIYSDFYIRLFVKICYGPKKALESICKTAMVYHCPGCHSFNLQPLGAFEQFDGKSLKFQHTISSTTPTFCQHCSSRHSVAGPVWIGNLHDKAFLIEVLNSIANDSQRLKTFSKIKGLLSLVFEEIETPFYFTLNQISKTFKINSPKMKHIRSALLHLGFKVSLFHSCEDSVKTDAPLHIFWDIIRCWEKQHPIKKEHLPAESPVLYLLGKDPSFQANFSYHDDAEPLSKQQKLLRFPMNPEKYWGPGKRAKMK